MIYISWSNDFVFYLEDYLMDELYTWDIGSVRHIHVYWPETKYVGQTYISWCSFFCSYLEDCLIETCHNYDIGSLWCKALHDAETKICVKQLSLLDVILNMPFVRTLILKIIALDTLSKFHSLIKVLNSLFYLAYLEIIQLYHLSFLISKIRNPLLFVTNITNLSVILYLISDLDIETSSPDSWQCNDSKFCYQPAGHIITGNLKIISDSRIRSII